MTSDRIEELLRKTAYPESMSVHQAMLQVWNEIQQDFNHRKCLNCTHYDFEDSSEQICRNINNHQLLEGNWYKMMVTPDFGCNEWCEL